MSSIHRFDCATTVLHGGGARHQVGQLAKELGGRRVLIVTDPGVIKLGYAEAIIASLRQAGLTAEIYADVQPDPTKQNVLDGFEVLKANGCDLIVALGGGSPIDTAKVISVLPANPGDISTFAGLHKIPHAGVPLIAIPTTAGTGSELTKVAVITDTDRDVKMMMLSAPLQPRAALQDFELTMSMPPALTAAVGVDTFTHGLEAYVSRKANAMSDPLALSCIRLVGQYLRRAYADPDDREARAAMMVASGQGGMAFSNSSVCLVHGMSRPIGAVFHVPHGLSNAMLLPAVTRFSVDGAPRRYAEVARVLGIAERAHSDTRACEALCAWLDALNDDLKIMRLSEWAGASAEKFEQLKAKMAQDALDSGSPANNPKVPTVGEIVGIYERVWSGVRAG
jgi:alcohol dehydrogenase class IV